jgi:hypothetical protein
MLAAAVVAVPAAAVLAMGLGAEAVPAVAGGRVTVRVGAAEAVPAMGRAGVVARPLLRGVAPSLTPCPVARSGGVLLPPTVCCRTSICEDRM